MKENEKDSFDAKNSSVKETPAERNTAPMYDYSKFDEYFDDINNPDGVVEFLHEIRASYLELSLYAEGMAAGNTEIDNPFSHDNVIAHSNLIESFINIIKSLKIKE